MRRCEVCGVDISHKRPGALTCGSRCRKRKQRSVTANCDEKLPVNRIETLKQQINHLHEQACEVNRIDLLRAIAVERDEHQRQILLLLQKWIGLDPQKNKFWK